MDLQRIKRLSKNLEPTGLQWVDELYDRHPRPYYRFLYKLAQELKPSSIVEIGVQTGVAAAPMLTGQPDALYLGIDPDEVWYQQEIEEAFPHTTFIQGYSQNVGSLSPTINLLFIDGEHTYNQAKYEYERYKNYVVKGGVIILDDINLDDQMRKLWSEIPDPKLELNFLHPEGGFGLLVKK